VNHTFHAGFTRKAYIHGVAHPRRSRRKWGAMVALSVWPDGGTAPARRMGWSP